MMGATSTIQGTGGALCEEREGNQDMMIAGGIATINTRVYAHTFHLRHTATATCCSTYVVTIGKHCDGEAIHAITTHVPPHSHGPPHTYTLEFPVIP